LKARIKGETRNYEGLDRQANQPKRRLGKSKNYKRAR